MNQDLKIKATLDLTKFQLDLVDTLEDMGYEWYYGHVYRKQFIEIKVSKFDKWSEVLDHFYKEGGWAKTTQIKNVLGIVDPRI